MSWFDAVILGLIQGLTEFLPVSSSGHLELAKALLGDESLPSESLLMTVVLHGATALSTVVVFRKDVWAILKGMFNFGSDEFHLSLKIILSMIPAAIVGVLFDDIIEAFFSGRLVLVGSMLLVTAVLLILADRAKKTDKTISYLQAFIVGVAQAIAILPGISRSGATISTSVIMKIDRMDAARFSFLMVVPLIFGKMAKDILDGAFNTSTDNLMLYAVGFVVAFFTGIVACRWMIWLVQKSQLKWFAIYCVIVGITAIIWAWN